MVDADFHLKAPVLGYFGRAGAADGRHLVAALELEADGADAGLALQAGLKGAEHHLAAAVLVEADVGRLDQIEIRAVLLVGFGEAPCAEYLAASRRRHGVASSSLGRRVRL